MIISHDVSWAPIPNTLSMFTGSGVADNFAAVPSPVTSAFAFVTRGRGQDLEVLLTHVIKRGLDLPGGHVEAGETPLEALIREVEEEVGLTISRPSQVNTLGWMHLRVDGPVPKDYGYPYPDTYMAVGQVHVDEDTEIRGSALIEEISGYLWVPVSEIANVTNNSPWASLVSSLT
jgi:8-oxo-dGTP diphosphatase